MTPEPLVAATPVSPVDLTRLEALATKIERQCNAADKRAARRCTARAEVRLDALELRPLLAAFRAVERVRALLAEPDRWHVYEPHELGEAFLVDTVRDWIDELRAALDGGAE